MISIDPNTLKVIDSIRLATSKILDNFLTNEKVKNVANPQLNMFSSSLKNRDPNNLSKCEKDALKRLKTNLDIIVKPADKGGATVIMNRDLYRAEALRQLNNTKYYSKIPESLATKNALKIKEIMTKIKNKKFITEAQYKYLTGPEDYSTRKFYLLPKIHKDVKKWPHPSMPEGRPIVSDTNSESSRAAEYIDSFLGPLATQHFSYLKNSYDFVSKIRNVEFPPNYLLVTGDVKSLYTNMDLKRTMDVVRETFMKYPDPARPDRELLELLEYTLYNNDFSFDNQQYLQLCGVPMGKKYSPNLSNLFLIYFDNCAKTGYSHSPEYYYRYLDDVHFIWAWGIDKLMEFQNYLNQLIPGIEITFEHSANEIPFLDVLLYIEKNTIQTRTYFKATDTHQLLHTASYHPKHTCMGILKSQFIRFKRLSSTYTDYHQTCNVLFSFLMNRGYSASAFRKLKYSIWYNYIPKTEPVVKNILPIIMPYSDVGKTLVKEYKSIIGHTEIFKNLQPVAAFKIAPSLRKTLIRSDFNHDKQIRQIKPTKNQFLKCGSRKCKCCIYYAVAGNKIKSNESKQDFTLVGLMDCQTKNVIYCIGCTKCQIQYVGETGRSVRDRLNNHLSDISLKKHTAISIHFNQSGHSKMNLKIRAIEKLPEQSLAPDRKQKEISWIKKLKTKYPYGLNDFPL